MFMRDLIMLLTIWVVARRASALICSRYPSNTRTPKSPVDENFVIYLAGNPQTYILGQPYNLSLHGLNGLRFVGFLLALENENGDNSYSDDLGHFDLVETVETRYSPNCVNMVESTNTNPKSHIDVSWVAPQRPGSGCVLIRATLLQHRDVWHMDDGGLTRRICEEVVDEVESQPIDYNQIPCCACDEARYELTFESLWSRNLHPKHFPTKSWITRFSDIVGTAHSSDYRFWEYGALATPGMRELAEHGITNLLEKEFSANFKNGKVRTVIKARTASFPNLRGSSKASVRVDPKHHLISLASKIEPSPDWIVGVSGLELCMANCTWLEHKAVNLYPWDIGTDAGPSYTSADQPQKPVDVIRRIRSDFPSDPRSPFFDETGAPMKPLAVLTITKQRLYSRTCEDEQSNNMNVPRECSTHPWTAWSECPMKCGEGRQQRTRIFKQLDVAKIYKCEKIVPLREYRQCFGTNCGAKHVLPLTKVNNFYNDVDNRLLRSGTTENESNEAECQLSEWSDWSACSTDCGQGQMVRERHFNNKYIEEKCQRAVYRSLQEFMNCEGSACSGDESRNQGRHAVQVEEMGPTFEAGDNYNNYISNMNNREGVPYFESDPVQPGLLGSNFEIRDLRNSANKKQWERHRSPQIGNKYDHYRTNYQTNEKLVQHDKVDQTRYPFASGTMLDEMPQVPVYCFQPLEIFTCLNTTVTGNYWFYNFCKDECMLYAVDACDQNENKFNSLEMCDMRCRQSITVDMLHQKQQQYCRLAEFRNSHREKYQRRNT